MEVRHRIDLYKLLPPHPVTVEIGSAEGLFSRDILTTWNPSLHFLVDNWGTISGVKGDGSSDQDWHDKNYENVLRLIEPFKDKCQILRGISWEMAERVPDDTIDLVYIDACHSYECVQKDIAAWWPKLKSGSVMAFHDFESKAYGVKEAVSEFASKHNLEINLIPEHKQADAGAWIRKP